MPKQKFKTKMKKVGAWTIAYTPIDGKKVFGKAGHIRIKGTIDGYPFDDVSLMPTAAGKHCLAIRADIRKEIRKKAGDTIEIILEEDFTELKIPVELSEAFEASEEAKKMFDAIAPSHRRMYIRHVNDSKIKETREKRAVKMVLDLEKNFFEKGLPKKKIKKI